MRFDVIQREPTFPADTPAIPQTLCTYPPTVRRTYVQWNFTRSGECKSTIVQDQRRVFNPDVPQHCVIKGTCEEWFINNNTPNADGPTNWAHPVHIHFEEFQILKRWAIIGGDYTEVPGACAMTGRKDVTKVEPERAQPSGCNSETISEIPDPLSQHGPRRCVHDGPLGHCP